MNTMDTLGLSPEHADRWAYDRLLKRPQPPQQPYGAPPMAPPMAAPNTVVPPTSPAPPLAGAQTSYTGGGMTPNAGASPRDPRIDATADEQAAWDREYAALPPGGSMNRQRPGSGALAGGGTPGSGFGPGGASNPGYRGPGSPGYNYGNNPPPGTPPGTSPSGRTTHAYTGGALDYYGTGDIQNVDHITRGDVGVTAGFTEVGLNGDLSVRGSNTIKNVNGRFFSNLPAKPSSIPILLAKPEFRALFPNAKQVGFDKIDYGDGKAVDVLEKADPNTDTATAWAWMPESTAVSPTAGRGYATWLSAQAPPVPPGTPPGTPPGGPGGPGGDGISDEARRLLARDQQQRPNLSDLGI